MNPSRTFILRPVATSLLMIGILLAGAAAFRQLPVSALPEVDYPTIQVFTTYPGASPDVMASSVTAPLERWFGQMPGLDQMNSSSSEGQSTIILQFDLKEDIEVAQQEVQQAINTAATYLPADLPTPPTYSKTNPADTPILTLALTSADLPLPQVEDLADTRLAPRISQMPGVGLVSVSGGQKPAIRIQANPTAMASMGVTLEDLRTALVSTNVNLAKGSFDGARQAYTIDSNDQLLSSSDYARIIIAYRNGAPVRLSDVATAVDSIEDTRRAAWMNDKPAVILNIQRQPGANIIAVADSIKGLLPQLTSTLPASVHVEVLTDRTTTIRASVADVEFELMLTVALVVMVIFLFLRTLSATIIPSIAVPLSIVGTFGVMYLLGYSLNNLTLMALTISTGFVVDDAIVMIENISRYIEEGENPLEAALKGSKQIGFTIISLTVSLIAVLIPLLFMADIVGRLFREFAITLAVTILVSAVVSLTLTPMMSAKLLKHRPEENQGRFYRVSERAFERIIEVYGRTLKWVLAHQALTLVVFVCTLGLTAFLFITIPKGFFPIQDTGVIQAVSEADQTVSFAAMAERQQALAKILLQDHAVQSLSSFIGIDSSNATLNSGRMLINLRPSDERPDDASAVIRRLRPKLAEVAGIHLYMQPVQDISIETRPTRTQYQYALQDPNGDELHRLAPEMLSRLGVLPEMRDVASDQATGGLRATVAFNRDAAARFGVTPQGIDNTLYDALGQRQVSTMFTQLNQYHVVLEVKPEYRETPMNLGDLYLRSTQVPSAQAGSSQTATAPVGAASSALAAIGTTAAAPVSIAASVAPVAPTATILAPIPNTPIGSAVPQSSIPGGAPSQSNLGGAPAASSAVFNNSGQVPLGALSHIELTNVPLLVNRQGQFPVVTISFNLAPGKSLGQAVEALNRVKDGMHLPASVTGAFQGSAAAFQASLANESLLILAAVITVYIVLGVLYESYIHPLTILSTLPSAGVGALAALMLTGNDFSVIALIGLVLLIGIVKKNAIMMIDFALEAERDQGKPPEEAIYQASLLRFRPIMMTTMAALLGGVPLALGTGMGSELRHPLGISIVGGLIVSQALTLYTTPVIYLFFDRLARRFRHLRTT